MSSKGKSVREILCYLVPKDLENNEYMKLHVDTALSQLVEKVRGLQLDPVDFNRESVNPAKAKNEILDEVITMLKEG